MQDQNQITSEPQASTPAVEPSKIVDVVAQPMTPKPHAASVAAPDPELVSEPAVEPAPAPAPVEAVKTSVATSPTPKHAPKKADPAIATPAQPKQPSTVPVGAIVSAIIIFLALAIVAFLAFQQGY